MAGRRFFDVQKHFWSRVKVVGSCWIWQGYVTTSGYGYIRFGGHTWKAHQLSWVIAYGGPIEKGVDICHTCDNGICVYPGHLFKGTRKDNMQDAKAKGRLHHPWILTVRQAQNLRRMRRQCQASYDSLGAIFKVSPMTAWNYVNNKNWTGVTG